MNNIDLPLDLYFCHVHSSFCGDLILQGYRNDSIEYRIRIHLLRFHWHICSQNHKRNLKERLVIFKISLLKSTVLHWSKRNSLHNTRIIQISQFLVESDKGYFFQCHVDYIVGIFTEFNVSHKCQVGIKIIRFPKYFFIVCADWNAHF